MSLSRAGTKGDERVVAGRYVLRGTLGSGGMGTVWRAHDSVLGREVALKEIVFPPGVSEQERDVLRERTRREARAAAGLHHPSAITVYDVVEDDGAPFIVMELVEAQTLADVVRTHGPVSPQRAAAVGLAVLDALDAAHRQGILHRDVKPSNVLLCDHDDPATEGRVVLTDFGIATSSGDSSITHTGLLLGSPNYIAPERARGQSPGPASDLWSLGATLFTAVEGRAPFDAGDVLATVTAVATGEPAEMQHAGPLAPVIDGLLLRDVDARLDAAGARRLLREVARGPQTPTGKTATVPAAAPALADRTAVLQVGGQHREAGPAPDGDAAPEPVASAPVAAAPAPPRPSAPRPSRPSAEPRRSARSVPLVLAAVLLLVSVVGVGALLLGRESDDGATAGTSTEAAEQEAPEQPAPEPAPAEPADEAPAEPPPAPEPAGADGPVPPPEGWQGSTGRPGWEVFVPASYAQGSFRGSPEYRDDSTGRTLRIETTGAGGGGEDAVQDRRDQARSFEQRYPSYEEIGIAAVDYRGYEAADWEFTYTPGGAPLHALSRVFVVDGRGYSLFFQTSGDDDWSAARAEFDRIAASFVPA